MQKNAHKNGYLQPLQRYNTRTSANAYDLIDVVRSDGGFSHPSNWSVDAVSSFIETAALKAVPPRLVPIEENTVPSWLWQRRGRKRDQQEATSEHSVTQIFDRFVGSALYNGWKQHLFVSEAEAQVWFDEYRYILAQRMVVIEPTVLAHAGLDWAYGIKTTDADQHRIAAGTTAIDIDNQTIDAIVSGRNDKSARAVWNNMLAVSHIAGAAHIRFSDTIGQWETTGEARQPAAAIDLLGFRHNDGTLNIDGLKQAVRMTAILFDLQSEDVKPHTIGLVNLAPLLMGLALAYDSNEARATAAAIAAIITSEATITSAEMARLRGKSAVFMAQIEPVMRNLRNHCRAVYGDQADYEWTLIVPRPLELAACTDLALVAAAQRGWDKALDDVRAFGMRSIHLTSCGLSRDLAFFSEAAAVDTQPLAALVSLHSDDGEIFRRQLHPSAGEALKRLGYGREQIRAITQSVIGNQTLKGAPALHHASLRKAGLDDAAIARIENSLPFIDDIRLALTPWVIGEKICREKLGVDADNMTPAGVMACLGYSKSDIAAANRFCYGDKNLGALNDLQPGHQAVLATRDSLSVSAHVRMAAAAQSFISEDVKACLTLPVAIASERFEKILLEAWRQGLKSLAIVFDDYFGTTVENREGKASTVKKSKAFLHAKTPAGLPTRKLKAKASPDLVAGKSRAARQQAKTKH